ncbi:MAG: hypothetical protein K9G70_14530 [Prolixibacteraceae bacterium]|nr:hypothetical protein [Prolixibacteraceae bacterium]
MKLKFLLIYILKPLIVSVVMLMVTLIISIIRPLDAEENAALEQAAQSAWQCCNQAS